MDQEEKDKELLAEAISKVPIPMRSDPKGKTEKKEVKRIVSGEVIQKKKNFFRRITDTFMEDDTQSVGNYILYDVLIPAAKDMIADTVKGGIEMMLFGERRGRRTHREGGTSRVNYNSMYRNRDIPAARRDKEVRDISRYGRQRHDFEELVIEQRGEAEDVLDQMIEMIMKYGQVSVADFYEMTGIPSTFQDNKWGWEDIREAQVRRVHKGYVIDLPRTVAID